MDNMLLKLAKLRFPTFRQFLKPSPLDWALPLFAEFYLNELDVLPDSTSLTWLCRVLVKRLKTHPSPHLLRMSMALAAHCSGPADVDGVRGELEALALSDPSYWDIPLADLDRIRSKRSEDKDDASMLSENDDNGNNLVETSPAAAVDKQLLERVRLYFSPPSSSCPGIVSTNCLLLAFKNQHCIGQNAI